MLEVSVVSGLYLDCFECSFLATKKSDLSTLSIAKTGGGS